MMVFEMQILYLNNKIHTQESSSNTNTNYEVRQRMFISSFLANLLILSYKEIIVLKIYFLFIAEENGGKNYNISRVEILFTKQIK